MATFYVDINPGTASGSGTQSSPYNISQFQSMIDFGYSFPYPTLYPPGSTFKIRGCNSSTKLDFNNLQDDANFEAWDFDNNGPWIASIDNFDTYDAIVVFKNCILDIIDFYDVRGSFYNCYIYADFIDISFASVSFYGCAIYADEFSAYGSYAAPYIFLKDTYLNTNGCIPGFLIFGIYFEAVNCSLSAPSSATGDLFCFSPIGTVITTNCTFGVSVSPAPLGCPPNRSDYAYPVAISGSGVSLSSPPHTNYEKGLFGGDRCGIGAYIFIPIVDFSASVTTGVAPLVVNFSDDSYNNPTSWSWDLGDGNTSTEQDPSNIYKDPGTYEVILEATNSCGTGTLVKPNYIIVEAPSVLSTIDIAIPENLTNIRTMPISGIAAYLFFKDNYGIRSFIAGYKQGVVGSGFKRPEGPTLLFD